MIHLSAHEDFSWLERRAEEEIVRATEACDARVVAFHYQLANLYLERLFGAPEAPPPASPA